MLPLRTSVLAVLLSTALAFSLPPIAIIDPTKGEETYQPPLAPVQPLPQLSQGSAFSLRQCEELPIYKDCAQVPEAFQWDLYNCAYITYNDFGQYATFTNMTIESDNAVILLSVGSKFYFTSTNQMYNFFQPLIGPPLQKQLKSQYGVDLTSTGPCLAETPAPSRSPVTLGPTATPATPPPTAAPGTCAGYAASLDSNAEVQEVMQ
jgi:hypothetical protein